jgi:hypothetical protein
MMKIRGQSRSHLDMLSLDRSRLALVLWEGKCGNILRHLGYTFGGHFGSSVLDSQNRQQSNQNRKVL